MSAPFLGRYTDLPIAPFSGWSTVNQIEGVLNTHDWGNLRQSAMLVDSMMRDDRISGTLNTRIGSLLASPLDCTPANESAKARKIAIEIGGDETQPGIWQQILPDSALYTILKYGRMLGMTVGEWIWHHDDELDRFVPRLKPWHPQWLYWDWSRFRWMLIAAEGIIELPNTDETLHSDGHWFVYAPHGYQYGWLSGMIRALARHYIARGWNFRDWARYNEKHGNPILGMNMPAETDIDVKNMVIAAVANINGETVIPLPVNEDGTKKYDLKIIEAVARSFDSFQLWKGQLDTDIAIAVLGQNLTTEVKGGSKAAAEIQNQVRIDKRKEDAAIAQIVRDQGLFWYAQYNYGDGELAPLPAFQVEPPEDETAAGAALKSLGDGIFALTQAAPEMIDVRTILEQEGVPVLSEEEIALNKAQKQEEALEQMKAQAAAMPPGGAGGPGQPGGGFPTNKQLPPGGGQTKALSSLTPTHRYEFQGFPIAVENAKGTIRVWHEDAGNGAQNIGSTDMLYDYGYIEGVKGNDKEELDVYVGPDESAPDVHVVHQQDKDDPSKFDEDKIMLGFSDAGAAKAAYLAHRNDGDRCFGSMSTIPVEKFRARLARRTTGNKIHASAMDGATVEALTSLARRVNHHRRGAVPLVARNRRPPRYPDRLEERSVASAAKALAPDVVGLVGAINDAADFSQLRKAVIAHYRDKMSPDKLAELVYKTQMLAHVAGRYTAAEEIKD